MKHRNKTKQLELKQRAFLNDRTIQSALGNHPGSYHKPGSFKKVRAVQG